ncbi:3 beta-hydroxysteroid dehydrogenase/Delta 5--_4-isomerase [Anatilimnocola aggregata]|uniref:3 beta-hydroxysteroid dehydrogenase/Delta 5-->4-isomerase n=1 Tax=Anatilimnocola aggregata TaxID=2528021 RepID=A0A517YJH7_9BACT|nr:NAD-dependent epimerase/dehydratase family protein [Anatilimnocola aggregata]QDU30365.1 3 beta-hydroxysteroid dehydrogenase/Delta 5-->4-isomerase [Anatilimnocola aggregata]
MHALVTGANGFLGGWIVEQLLARGDRVRALVRRDAPELAAQGADIARGDIRDLASLQAATKGIDAVFHVAAIAGIWGPKQTFWDVNVTGTANVLEACLQNQVPRLIYTGSPSVTFAGGDQQGVDESVPYPEKYLCHYPQTKAVAEELVLDANSPELMTCALRPHLIWGPRDQHLIPRLLERARSGKLRYVGDRTNLIDAVYVENAAAAHLQAADALQPGSPVGGKAYFITNDEPVNCWNWIDELLALAGLPPVKKGISTRGAYLAGTMLEGLWTLLRRTDEPRMTRFLALQLGTSHYFNIAAAKRDFGYEPKISMAEGMRRLKASWRS